MDTNGTRLSISGFAQTVKHRYRRTACTERWYRLAPHIPCERGL
jgi:hypothetical protein